MNVGPTKAVTVTVTVCECEREPLVPFTERVNVAGANEELTVIVSTDLLVGLPAVSPTGLGTNMARTPLGGVDVARFTLPVNPLMLVRVMFEVPETPAEIVREVGLAVSVKSVTTIAAEPVLVA